MQRFTTALRVLVLLTAGVVGCKGKDAATAEEGGAIPVSLTGVPGAAEKVTFDTADGWTLTATYWFAGPGKPAAVLLHMLPADRHSYDELGPKLAGAGFNTLALDSRGHGESRTYRGATKDFHDFTTAEYISSVEDITAAKGWLAARGADKTRLVLVGASIGANFALIYGARDPDVRGVVLLSPGLDYHGVKTEDAMAGYRPRPAYVVAAEDDADSAACVRRLREIHAGAETVIWERAGHGTNIFRAQPKLQDEIVAWLAATVK